MRLKLTFFLLLFLCAGLTAEDNWRLVGSKIIYTNEGEHIIELSKKWKKISSVEAPFIENFPPPAPGYIRKWRLFTSYSDSAPSTKTSIQIKFLTKTYKKPLFSLTRPLGYSGKVEGFSNWFQFQEGDEDSIYKGDAAVFTRMISPPSIKNSGNIYHIELQAWDKLAEETGTMAAAGNRLPSTNDVKSVAIMPKELPAVKKNKEEAMEFSMQVMSSIFSMDYNEFNELTADRCYSLETGKMYTRQSFPLFAQLKEYTNSSHVTLASYKENYKPQLISFEEYSELFPHWLDKDREWKPGKNDFLFLGNMIKKDGKQLTDKKIMVFMVGFDRGRWYIKAVPE